ncbi:RNA polymerase sigma factor [Microbacterium jejuense]|uniref:RNA polymerase sigma factor n=1 Tax=Microbacterium jejuense TaxID=1263637 RepID=UPI0031F168B8
MSTDSDIIRRSADDPAAFAELFERHARVIGGFAARRVGVDAAEDVLSETMLVAFRRRGDFDTTGESARPWLLGIASRVIKKHHAAEARQWRSFEASAGGDGGTFEYYLDDRDLYADLPSDVPGAIDWFSRRYDGEGDAEGLAHYFAETISDVAVFNLAPAAARASMLRAFATLDHVDVVATSGDRTTLRYARVRQDGDAAPIEFTLDTARGYVLEVTSWPYGADAGAGSGGWTSRTTAEIAVVDSAP